MRILIAVVTCRKFSSRADTIRKTWGQNVEGADLKFFVGRGETVASDTICLDAPDDYGGLREKVQKMFEWASANKYDFVFKTDDDVYVIPSRLLAERQNAHYVGRRRGPSGTYREVGTPREWLPTGMELYGETESDFASGFGYWLSGHAASIAASAPSNGDWAEDRFVGNVLARAGIHPVHDQHFLLWPRDNNQHSCVTSRCRYCQAKYNEATVLCPHVRPDIIEMMHAQYTSAGFVPTWL